MIFKGTYRLGDRIVVLKENGKVQGLDDYTNYVPNIDYIGSGMQVNQIKLENKRNEVEYLGFDFKNDTLNIYKLKCLTVDTLNDDCFEVEFGKLKYKLIKEK